MKMKIIAVLIAMTFACSTGVYAAPGGEKGASDKAYENASENSIFKRVGDWFGGIGKSDEEKAAMKAEKKAKKEAKERQKAMEEEAEQMKDKVKKEKVKKEKMEREAGKAKSDMNKGSGKMKGSMKTK